MQDQERKEIGRRMYSLSQAAEVKGISAEQILDLAIDGGIRLCIPKPDGCRIFSVMPETLVKVESSQPVELSPISTPRGSEWMWGEDDAVEYLILSPEDCCELARRPFVQKRFQGGYRVTGLVYPRRLTPNHRIKHSHWSVPGLGLPVYTTHEVALIPELDDPRLGHYFLSFNGENVRLIHHLFDTQAVASLRGVQMERDQICIAGEELLRITVEHKQPVRIEKVASSSNGSRIRRDALRLEMEAIVDGLGNVPSLEKFMEILSEMASPKGVITKVESGIVYWMDCGEQLQFSDKRNIRDRRARIVKARKAEAS